jgi:hypothetical protein
MFGSPGLVIRGSRVKQMSFTVESLKIAQRAETCKAMYIIVDG